MARVMRKRPSEFRIRETLDNGQQVNLYFERHSYRCSHNEDKIAFQWHIGFYIGPRKEANLWYKKSSPRKPDPIKGDGSLFALRWALSHITGFLYTLKSNEELIVSWGDERRKSAYRYLERHGFVAYYENEKMLALGNRNPHFWEWIEE